MRDKIKDTLTDLLSAVKVAKFYSVEHPQFQDFIGRAFDRLQEVFKERSEFVIGIVEGETRVIGDGRIGFQGFVCVNSKW